jgi:cell wall-associated NlpC family hydrolase
MFVLDGARARVVAIAMTIATVVPIFPKAHAIERPRVAAAEGTEAKAPRKSKKKKAVAAHDAKHRLAPTTSWGPRAFGLSHPQKKMVTAAERKHHAMKVVLAAARKQLGKPYHWGSIGPSSFDCSGFTMYVWNKAGVSLPHNSSAQRDATKRVPLKDMRPGDLVFSPGHVGLYIGAGKMIHAPHSGSHVQIAPIHGSAYAAGRPAV